MRSSDEAAGASLAEHRNCIANASQMPITNARYMLHRHYKASDRNDLIRILRANMPKYFSPEDEAEFIRYLDEEQWDINYTYINNGAEIIGCAGSYVDQNSNLCLCWTFFSPGSIGHSRIATTLDHHISASACDLGISEQSSIFLNTTQIIARYLGRIGFNTAHIVQDGYGPGYDKVTMTRQPAQRGGARMPLGGNPGSGS
jgi:hypothetical protein